MIRPTPAGNPLAEDLEHVLAYTGASLWDEVRGKTLFITGGTGFFGRWLLESFVAANAQFSLGARAVVLSRNPAPFQSRAPHLSSEGGVEFVRGDVRSFTADDVASQCSGRRMRFDLVIHAATESNSLQNLDDPLLMLDTVVQGTRAALEFAAATGVQRFLLTSSGAVYGRQPHTIERVREDYIGGPDLTTASSAYAEGKRAAEVLCACYAQRRTFEPVIARCFSFFGPHLPLDAHLATANFIRDALAGEPVRVSGTGADVRSYLYVADLAIWLWTILLRGKGGQPYNVGSEHSVTIAEWAREIAGVLAPSPRVEGGVEGLSGAAASRYVPATGRAQRELGLAERISRREGLLRFQRWRQRQEALSPRGV